MVIHKSTHFVDNKYLVVERLVDIQLNETNKISIKVVKQMNKKTL